MPAWVLVLALTGGPEIPLPQVGDVWEIQGRITHHDHDPRGDLVWIETMDGRMVSARRMQDGGLPPEGALVQVAGIRGEDASRSATTGEPLLIPSIQGEFTVVPADGGGLTPLLLVGLGGLLLIIVAMGWRRGRASSLRRCHADGIDWSDLDETDLPDDPVEALAEMARRTDGMNA